MELAEDVEPGHEEVGEERRQDGPPDHSRYAKPRGEIATDRQVHQGTDQGRQGDHLDLVESDRHLHGHREHQGKRGDQEESHERRHRRRVGAQPVAEAEGQERSRIDPGQQPHRQQQADVHSCPVILDPLQPSLVARGRQACHGGHHQISKHPAGLSELKEGRAHQVVDRDLTAGRLGKQESEDRGIDLVGEHHADLDQGHVETDVPQSLVIGPSCSTKMRCISPIHGSSPRGPGPMPVRSEWRSGSRRSRRNRPWLSHLPQAPRNEAP